MKGPLRRVGQIWSASARLRPRPKGAPAELSPNAGTPRRNLLPLISRHLRFWSDPAGDEGWKPAAFNPPQADSEPDLDDILAEQPPRLMRSIHYVIVAGFVTILFLASILNVDIIVAATGRLITETPTIVVQPMQLSVVRELRVTVGDVVHKGDVLATLDPTFAQADKAVLATQEEGLQAQIARLQAELDDTPLQIAATTPEQTVQVNLYNERRAQYATRLRGFDEDIERDEAAIHSVDDSRASLAQQLDIAKEVEAMRTKLFNLQAGSKLNLLDAQSLRLRNEQQMADASDKLNELRHGLASKKAERQAFVDEWRHELLDELVKARNDAATLGGQLTKATRMDDLVVLRAPADGVVSEIGKRSVGSVAQPAEPLVTLIPTDAPLVAEIMINSADVGFTTTGDEVALKIDAYPYQQHGLLKGVLRSVGEDVSSGAVTSPSAPTPPGIYHRSRVQLTDTRLHDVPAGTHLIPGLSLTAEIKVGSRSVISYFLYPISRGLSESIREP
jgi:HlyD family secretion protein